MNSQISPLQSRFEWVDGALTHAIERGGWVLLDNANLCNPTVLDRLNPLLEPSGVLLLNEAGTVDGRARLLRPHPDFRIFLAMDPGCVSPALCWPCRNSYAEAGLFMAGRNSLSHPN